MSGFFFFNKNIKGKKDNKKIVIYESLLLIKPFLGKILKYLKFKSITSTLFSDNFFLNLSHSPQVLITETLYLLLYFDNAIDELIVEITVPTGFKQGDQ